MSKKRKPSGVGFLQREEVKLWMADSDDSVKVAEQNFELGNYHVSAFYLHAAIEKALKAAIVALKRVTPPKTHNLKRLYAEVSKEVELSLEEKDFLGELTPASQVARYVDIAVALPRDVYSRSLLERYFKLARPILEKIEKRLKS